MSVAVSRPSGVGDLLREWRQRRRLSQMDLSNEAEVSARHLSFVETGRSKPSRELLLHLAEHLDVPLRDRNGMLLAAGYAPVYKETALDAETMGPVRSALDKILTSHQPYPAVIVDRRWDLVSANDAALGILTEDVDPALLQPPVNAMRVSLHPDGLATRIRNFDEYSAHLITRLHRQAAMAGDDKLDQLLAELKDYPNVSEASTLAVEPADLLFAPLIITSRGRQLTFFSTLATFGTALDITMAELAIESFYPGDAETAEALRQVATP
jgi:transcriptional regulator with XRE-family HTH domain